MSNNLSGDPLYIEYLKTASTLDALSSIHYRELRDLAAKHLSYQALAQCLQPKLPYKPGVSEAWERLADCIMCSQEEADKRRILENEIELRMRTANARHNQRKREQSQKQKQTIAAVLDQHQKLQKTMDELQQSITKLQEQLNTLQ